LERRNEIVEALKSSSQAFQEAVAGVSDEAATLSPGPERWSILQVVEHVVVAERGQFGALQRSRLSEKSLENPEKEAMIRARGASRLNRYESPERARPSGRFPSLAQALDEFIAAREETIRFAAEHEENLYFRQAMHPMFGAVNGYELLLIMAAHTRRHTEQIAEIRAAAAG
jgi:hypothetical protein